MTSCDELTVSVRMLKFIVALAVDQTPQYKSVIAPARQQLDMSDVTLERLWQLYQVRFFFYFFFASPYFEEFDFFGCLGVYTSLLQVSGSSTCTRSHPYLVDYVTERHIKP